jgi:hypothetical protein
MVAEENSIEYHIEAISNLSIDEQLPAIAILSARLRERNKEEHFALSEESVIPEVLKPVEEKRSKAILLADLNADVINNRANSKDGSVKWKSLWGAWKDSTPDGLHVLIRND